MKNILLDLIKPYLNTIDNGQVFRQPMKWLYLLVAVINLLIPLKALDGLVDIWSYAVDSFEVGLGFIVAWIILAIGGFIGFQLWWHRSAQVSKLTEPDAEFVAIPVFAHLIKTVGEWIGTSIGVFGTLITFITMILMVDFLEKLPIAGKFGFLSFIMTFIIGFLVLLISRFVSEQLLAFAAIANNTKGLDQVVATPAPVVNTNEEIDAKETLQKISKDSHASSAVEKAPKQILKTPEVTINVNDSKVQELIPTLKENECIVVIKSSGTIMKVAKSNVNNSFSVVYEN